MNTPRPAPRWRFSVLALLLVAVFAAQDATSLPVRVGAVAVFVVGAALAAPSRATAVAAAGLTAVGAGLFVLLSMAAGLPFAGTATSIVLAALLWLGGRAAVRERVPAQPADTPGRGDTGGRCA